MMPENELQRSTTFLDDKERPGFFKEYHKSVRNAVSNDNFNEFCSQKTDQGRISVLLKIPAVHEHIDIKPFYKSKSEREALDKKEAGNKAFIYKNNLEALKLYSQAVVKAPVPSEENADPKKMTLYAICLANRSAALFHLKEFYYCIRDIEEALEHHYPKELKYKLYKRKGRLLVSFKRHEEARDSYRQALKWLDWAKMDREKRNQQQSEIQKWLRLFEGAKVCKNAPWEEIHMFPKVPDLVCGHSEKFPALSNKLEVRHEEKSGRFVVATTDIEPGDTLVTEQPYASVLLLEEYGTHCQNCLAITKSPIPCKTCSGVIFCSVACRDNSYFHKVECPILNLLHGSGMSINCFLALRMLTQTPLSYFMNIKESLQDEDPKAILERETPYNGTEFLRVNNLVRHAEQRTPEDFFHRGLMAVFLAKALKKTKYFFDFSHLNGKSLSEIEAFVGGLLLRFLQIVQFNAHEMSEFRMKYPRNLDGATNCTLGAAIYPTLALFNHSCQPTLVRYFSGKKVITKAARPIPKGQWVTENYGPCFATKERTARRVQLNDRYWFQCACEPCKVNWPMFKNMKTSVLNFKCHKCKAPIEVNVETPTPFFRCNKCDDQTNILSALKNLQNTEETFKAAMSELQDFNLEKAESLLTENLKQLDLCLYQPYKDYHLAQEALMKCGLCMGNRRVLAEDLQTNIKNFKK